MTTMPAASIGATPLGRPPLGRIAWLDALRLICAVEIVAGCVFAASELMVRRIGAEWPRRRIASEA